MSNIIKLGTDPEIFFENDKEIVSVVGLIEGTKDEPFAIDANDHYIQVDNIAAEFNIPPCSTSEEYIRHINIVKNYLEIVAKGNGLNLSKKASAEINPKYLQSVESQTFGCEPDFNVYLEDLNPPPNINTNLRCVGGHVHIGYPNPEFSTSTNIVKMFDILVTLPSLLIDNDERRRELYGKAGSFRIKDFGVECRALSNFWIHEDSLIEWVFNQTIKAVNIVLENNHQEYIDNYSKLVCQAIDTNDKKLAKQLLLQIKEENKILTK
jgi:hypothetical protein